MQKLKRIPLFTPFFMIAEVLVGMFYHFPLWCIGYWWCADCNKRCSLKDRKVEAIHTDICEECYKANW